MKHIDLYKLFEEDNESLKKLPKKLLNELTRSSKNIFISLSPSIQKEILDKSIQVDKLINDPNSKSTWKDFGRSSSSAFSRGKRGIMEWFDEILSYVSRLIDYNLLKKDYTSRYIVTGVYGKDDYDRYVKDNSKYDITYLSHDKTIYDSYLDKGRKLICLLDLESIKPRLLTFVLNRGGDIFVFVDNSTNSNMSGNKEATTILEDPIIKLIIFLTKSLIEDSRCEELMTTMAKAFYKKTS